jgi:signal recognition particle subunit SEC65
MSNDFAKSEWCQWEVDIVQERRRRLGRDVFLLVMLKNITSKYMTSPLRQIYYEPKVDQHHNIQQKRGIQNHQSRLLVHSLVFCSCIPVTNIYSF